MPNSEVGEEIAPEIRPVQPRRRLSEEYRRLSQPSDEQIGMWLTEMWRLALYYSDLAEQQKQ